MNEITQLQQEHNQRMDVLIAAASTLTQEQIDACAWVMGASGAHWTKSNIAAELSNEKFDVVDEVVA